MAFKLLSFGTDTSEVAYARGGELLPVPPRSLTNGGKPAQIGGSFTSGIGQGVGFGLGLAALGAAFVWMKQRR